MEQEQFPDCGVRARLPRDNRYMCLKRGGPYFQRLVTVDLCKDCLFNAPSKPDQAQSYRPKRYRIKSDGTIVYEHLADEWEPPKDIYGYQRDPNDPWRFTSKWPKCERREQINQQSSRCQCLKVLMRCTHPDSKCFNQQLSLDECQQCPLREEENL